MDIATRVKISAPAGTISELATLDGWEFYGGGVFVVTDPDWRDDANNAFGARILSVEEIEDE